MSRRLLVASGVAAVAAVAVAVVPAGAKSGPAAKSTATLVAKASGKVVINKYIQDNARWVPGKVTIKSGGTLTLKNVGGAPHTFSIVNANQLPHGIKGVNTCAVCGQIAQAHGADPNSQAPPTNLVVDTGATGFDQAGDSVFFMKTTKVQITAKPGTTLRFLCAIHPWMQGELVVR